VQKLRSRIARGEAELPDLRAVAEARADHR